MICMSAKYILSMMIARISLFKVGEGGKSLYLNINMRRVLTSLSMGVIRVERRDPALILDTNM